MKIIEKKDNKIIFTAEIEESLANALRRYVNQIPVLAIDEVEISKNDSALYDETIAHRIGLIPLEMQKVDEKKLPKLKLDIKKEGLVYSKDFMGDMKIVYGEIPITHLNKGQELQLTATGKLGLGKEHTKFSPGILFYREIVDVKTEKDCPKEVIETCPKKILRIEGGKIIVSDNLKCDMCEACVDFCKKQGKGSIKLIPTGKLLIAVESFGQLGVEEIFKKSVDVLKKDLAEVSKKLGK